MLAKPDGKGKLIRHGYIRVSTKDQATLRREDGLRELCDRQHVEQAFACGTRPVFEKLIYHLKTGDFLVVWSLDRALRSTLDTLNTADLLRNRKIGFEVVNLSIDLTSPEGRVFYTLTAALDQAERERLPERTRQGMAAAKRRGVHVGRPPKLTEQMRSKLRLMAMQTDWPITNAANLFEVSPSTIRRALKRDMTPRQS